MKIKTEVDVEIPSLPNFIRVKSGESVSIRTLSVEVLEKIADEWKRQLLNKARS